MTISEFETFEKELLKQLRKDNKKCLKVIEKNSKLVEKYLNGDDVTTIKKFVNDFNNVVLDREVKKYKYFEAVLKHNLFTKVLAQFRESDVLIRACRDVKILYYNYDFQDHEESCNTKVIKWLLTMNMNYAVQDENGMTALMNAVKYVKLKFVVKELINNEKLRNQLDNDGNNVLFHAANNFFSLEKFLPYKDMYDPNYVNNNNENILLYSCRLGRLVNEKYCEIIKKINCTEPNISNADGKTAAMYLAEYGRYKELKDYIEYYKIDPNYVNKFGNSLVSVLVKKYYKYYSIKTAENNEGFGLTLKYFKRYLITLRYLVEIGCDFKTPIEEDGTTVVMILTKLHDEVTSKYLLDKGCIDFIIDTKKKNNYPEIDMTNPIVQKNSKSVQMWARESLYPNGAINTRTTGLIMMGMAAR